MKILITIFLLCSSVVAQELPNAPSTVQPPKSPPKFFTMSRPKISEPMRTNQEVILSKSFLGAHVAWLGSAIFTVEMQHAHPYCVAPASNSTATRAVLYSQTLAPLLLSIADWAASKYVWQPASLIAPVTYIVKNLQSGVQWSTECK